MGNNDLAAIAPHEGVSDSIMKPESGLITGNSEHLSWTLPPQDPMLPEGRVQMNTSGTISQTTEILCEK